MGAVLLTQALSEHLLPPWAFRGGSWWLSREWRARVRGELWPVPLPSHRQLEHTPTWNLFTQLRGEAVSAWPFWQPNKYTYICVHEQTHIWVCSAHPSSIPNLMFSHWGCTFSAKVAWLMTIQISLAGMRSTQQGSNVWAICISHQLCLATRAVMLQQIL